MNEPVLETGQSKQKRAAPASSRKMEGPQGDALTQMAAMMNGSPRVKRLQASSETLQRKPGSGVPVIQLARYTWTGGRWVSDGGASSSKARGPRGPGRFEGQVYDDSTGRYSSRRKTGKGPRRRAGPGKADSRRTSPSKARGCSSSSRSSPPGRKRPPKKGGPRRDKLDIDGIVGGWASSLGTGPGRRSVAGRPVTIGVSDRGRGHEFDMPLVAMGTGANVVSLGAHHPDRDVDGAFIPGGRYDLPGTTATFAGRPIASEESTHWPKTSEEDRAWQERTGFQADLITHARDSGLPILGVCGGSRSMAQSALAPEEGRGSTYLLSGDQSTKHNQYFGRPWDVAHTIDVDEDSHLGRIMRGEHWRDDGQPLLTHPMPEGANPALYAAPEERTGGPLRVPVNSMHWAGAGFEQRDDGPVKTTAVDSPDGSGEPPVVEGWERRDGGMFMGIQSHPEFAQIPHGDFDPAHSLRHQRVMAALGQAATENVALGIMRENVPFRGGVRRARNRARLRIRERQTRIAALEQAHAYAATLDDPEERAEVQAQATATSAANFVLDGE